MTHLRNTLLLSFLLALAFLLALGSSFPALAQQQVTLIAPAGAQAAIEALIPGFEAGTVIKSKRPSALAW